MEPELRTILESLPEKPYRSKLEPHRELIRELRRKGRTYREVARLFDERLGLYVAPSTLAFLREGPRQASQANTIRIAAVWNLLRQSRRRLTALPPSRQSRWCGMQSQLASSSVRTNL